MSSSGGNRKSMDDVLSSIRRIIGAEKKDGYDDLPDPDGPDAGRDPLTLGAPIRPGNPPRPDGPDTGAGPQAATGSDPLSLTPNMRVDFTKLTRDEPEPSASPEPLALSPRQQVAPPAAEPAVAAPSDADEDAMLIDEAALEEMIRRIVREELDAREGEAGPDDDQIRRVLREELAGETGQNISRNVKKLIGAEVARLLAERD